MFSMKRSKTKQEIQKKMWSDELRSWKGPSPCATHPGVKREMKRVAVAERVLPYRLGLKMDPLRQIQSAKNENCEERLEPILNLLSPIPYDGCPRRRLEETKCFDLAKTAMEQRLASS